ncbi:MAG: DNA repair protein RecN [Flavobacteriales bacterium]|nr:DNA repair protein RecN [Flavobacteriales bacterium]
MISSLRIENFALIDAANISFNKGFTVITGETGSGKSILLNALNLILGERANFSVIGNLKDKSTVEAEIEIGGFDLEIFFEANELDYFDKTIVRREISKQGRSRAFINDTPVQLGVLKAFSSQLIHIHSQYNTLELKDVNFQLRVLDVLAETEADKSFFAQKFEDYSRRKKLLSSKREELQKSISQSDYNNFQLEELEALQLMSNDFEKLQNDLRQGENADDIRSAYNSVIDSFQGNDGVLDKLGGILSALRRAEGYDEQLKVLSTRIEAITIEVNDIVDDAEEGIQKIDFDPRKLDELVAKIDGYNRISLKHRVNTQSELMAIMLELQSSSISHGKLEEEIQLLESELIGEQKELSMLASDLHSKRLGAKEKIEDKIKLELSELKLENTELIFDLSLLDEFNSSGNSKLEILFSPNVGVAAVPIHKAASGGELSRVMLALQSLMSSKIQLRTMLFDEIDTGVSGDVAQKMGATLKKMGEAMQVIAITHLPQVAAKGAQHLKVLKEIVDGQTKSFVVLLDDNQRIEETARLMSGDQINDAALENAKALMA